MSVSRNGTFRVRVRVTRRHFDRGEECKPRPANLISSSNSIRQACIHLASNSDQRMQRSSSRCQCRGTFRVRVRVTRRHFDRGEECKPRPANLISSSNSIRQACIHLASNSDQRSAKIEQSMSVSRNGTFRVRVRVTRRHFDRGEECKPRPANLISSSNSIRQACIHLASNSDQRMQRSSSRCQCRGTFRVRVRVTRRHFDRGEECKPRPANLISSSNSIRQACIHLASNSDQRSAKIEQSMSVSRNGTFRVRVRVTRRHFDRGEECKPRPANLISSSNSIRQACIHLASNSDQRSAKIEQSMSVSRNV